MNVLLHKLLRNPQGVSIAYNFGYECYIKEMGPDDCPYPKTGKGAPYYKAWFDGFNKGVALHGDEHLSEPQLAVSSG